MKLSAISNYSYQNNRNSNIHFDGTGKLVLKYHKITEKRGRERLAQKLEKSEFFKNLFKKTKEGLIEVGEDLKRVLIERNIINEQGDIIALQPRLAIIENGNAHIPDRIKADTIAMNGGEIESLVGQKVNVAGGTVTKRIVAKKLTARKDFVIPTSKVIRDLELKEESKIGKDAHVAVKGKTSAYDKSKVEGNLTTGRYNLFNNAQTAEGSTVIVKGETIVHDEAVIGGNLETGGFELHQAASTAPSSDVKVVAITYTPEQSINTVTSAHDKSIIGGKLETNKLFLHDSATLAQGSDVQVKKVTYAYPLSTIAGKLETARLKRYENPKITREAQVTVNSKSLPQKIASKIGLLKIS